MDFFYVMAMIACMGMSSEHLKKIFCNTVSRHRGSRHTDPDGKQKVVLQNSTMWSSCTYLKPSTSSAIQNENALQKDTVRLLQWFRWKQQSCCHGSRGTYASHKDRECGSISADEHLQKRKSVVCYCKITTLKCH